MAILTELNSASSKDFIKGITSQVYDGNVVMAKLKANGQVSTKGGTKAQWAMRHSKLGTSQETTARARTDFQSVETRGGCEADWAYYKGYTMLHWDEEIVNAGKAQIIDLKKDKYEELKEDMDDHLGSVIHGTATTGIAPLVQIIDATDSYGGVDPANYTEWKATEDSSTTTLTIKLLDYNRNLATFRKFGPTLYLTTRDLYSKYESLLEAKERYIDKKTVDLGFDNILYHGKPVVPDPACTSGNWYGIDLTAFEILEKQAIKPTEWFSLKSVGYPHAYACFNSGVLQLICKRRKTNFKLTALDYSL